ncbi:hypothetical protein ACIBP6_39285 [Nonomuraea terrae]|uniref:hypothetical protein n=1 Tax=Nonomuraea terrae TaxID=2530383 RepID=UPI00379254FF
MSGNETPVVQIKRMDVEVEDCGQIHLLDNGGEGSDDFPSHSVGLIAMEGRGFASMHIALQWGVIPFTVAVADRDPGADLDGYEDIVEIGFESPSGEAFLAGWAMDWNEDKVYSLRLPAGPGKYRLRYHARGMDEESYRVDDYYLQIWPAPQQDPAVLKTTSQFSRYLLDLSQ